MIRIETIPALGQACALSPTGAEALATARPRAAPAALLGELDARLEGETGDAARARLIGEVRRLIEWNFWSSRHD